MFLLWHEFTFTLRDAAHAGIILCGSWICVWEKVFVCVYCISFFESIVGDTLVVT